MPTTLITCVIMVCMPTFSSDMQILDLELFDAAFAVAPGKEDEVKRRFMTLLVHVEGRHRGGTAEVCRATNAQGEVFALKRLRAASQDADPTMPSPFARQDTPVRKELRHSAGSGSGSTHGSSGTPDYVTQGHIAAFYEEYRVHLGLSGLRGFPRLYGFGLAGGNPVIVMEWVEGTTLRQALRDWRDAQDDLLPLSVVARLGIAVLELLLRARELEGDFVHRDISPRNIMLREDRTPAAQQLESGEFDLCLIDFGSSSLREGNPADPTFTMGTNVWRMGTPAYAPPEMLTSDIALPEHMRQSPAIDVYALCSVLYQLYGGSAPFELHRQDGLSPYRVKTEAKPAPLTVRDPDGGALAGIIHAGISPQQESRPSTQQLADALRNWLLVPQERRAGTLGSVRPAQAGFWQPDFARRTLTRRRLLSVGIVCAGALAGAAIAVPKYLRGLKEPLDASRYARASRIYDGEPLWRAYDGELAGWMLCSAEGTIACKPSSSRPIGALRQGLAALYDDISRLWGFITPTDDAEGYAWHILPAFSQVGEFSEDRAAAQDPETHLWGLVDLRVAWVAPARFQSLGITSQGVTAAQDAESLLWGAVDDRGSWVIEPRFSALGSRDDDGHAVAQDSSGTWGIVADDGSWASDSRFSQLRRYVQGLAPAHDQQSGLWGFVDEQGSWEVEPTYQDARPFCASDSDGSEVLAAVQDVRSGLWCFVDSGGSPSANMKPSLWKLGDLYQGLAPAQAAPEDDTLAFDEADPDSVVRGVGGRYGYVDATGAWQMRRLTTLTDTAIGAAHI